MELTGEKCSLAALLVLVLMASASVPCLLSQQFDSTSPKIIESLIPSTFEDLGNEFSMFWGPENVQTTPSAQMLNLVLTNNSEMWVCDAKIEGLGEVYSDYLWPNVLGAEETLCFLPNLACKDHWQQIPHEPVMKVGREEPEAELVAALEAKIKVVQKNLWLKGIRARENPLMVLEGSIVKEDTIGEDLYSVDESVPTLDWWSLQCAKELA